MTELMIRPQSDVGPYEPHEPYDPTQDNGEIIEGQVISDTTESLVDSQTEAGNESTASYEQPSRLSGTLRRIADRLDKRSTDRMYEDAYRMNDKFDAKVARKEKINQAKERISVFGRAALGRMKNLGLITLGLGIMTGEAGARGAKRGYEASKSATVKFGENVGDGFIAGMEKVNSGMDTVGEKVASVNEAVSDYKKVRQQKAERRAEAAAGKQYESEAAKIVRKNEKTQARQERLEAARERAMQRKEAAIARKEARRNKWAARRERFKGYASSVKKEFIDTKDAVKETAKNTYEKAKNLTNEQKAKIGDLALRARASGEAAVETWKNYPDR